MRNYRFYRLDGDGKISTADWIEAADDDEARREAELRNDSGTYELWDRDRRIARIQNGSA